MAFPSHPISATALHPTNQTQSGYNRPHEVSHLDRRLPDERRRFSARGFRLGTPGLYRIRRHRAGGRHRTEYLRRAPERRRQSLRPAPVTEAVESTQPRFGHQPHGLPGRREGQSQAAGGFSPRRRIFTPFRPESVDRASAAEGCPRRRPGGNRTPPRHHGWGTATAPRAAWSNRIGLHSCGLRLFTCLFLLRHSLPPRRGVQPAAGRGRR